MALTDLQRLRLKVADRAKTIISETVGRGDGAETFFKVIGSPLVAASQTVKVNGAVQVAGTDYTCDDAQGLLTFSTAPASGQRVTVTYQFTVFSDDELQDLLDRYTLNGAAAEAITWLLADTDRFLKYAYAQESVDRSQARQNLQDLLGRLQQTGGPVGLVIATTPAQIELLDPFRVQREGLADEIASS